MFHIHPLSAPAGIALLALGLASAAEPSRMPPLVPAVPPSDLLLAQAAPAGPADAPQGSALQGSAPLGGDADSADAPRSAAPRRRRSANASVADLEAKRDHFRGMQNTGFGLMMGGIGAGGGGLILMINALANLETHTDAYGNSETSEPPATFWIGYTSLVLACPALLTTGIILNRIGNHKRVTYERLIQESGGAHLDLGPNSLRFTYRF